jgi:predicted transcriptional regulator
MTAGSEVMPAMEAAKTPKAQAHELIDQLPDNASWHDLAYRMVVRWEIERGLADSDAGRVTPVEEVMREFGIDRPE